MARVALLSNPRSTGNRSLLPRVRSFCAEHKDIFHYEVEHVDQIGTALKTIARVKPKVLVINGGDGTVQAALTELYHGGHFGGDIPPVAVLPNGKTNLIALDLGADGDPLEALKRVMEIARTDMNPHIVSRELIALSDGSAGGRPVLGMFLGGAGLADTMLYCRHKIYPLGLPNGFSHVLTVLAALLSIIFGIRGALFPPKPEPVKVSVLKHGQIQGQFAFLMVTTLERLLLGGHSPKAAPASGALQLMVIERSSVTLIRALIAAIRGKLGRRRLSGVHLERGDEIRIEGDHSSVILDGELFEASRGHPIVLKPTPPVPFLRLAA
ncbi:MAG TPA: diacylglycerol kinase family protein [Allosphingosinicella sp.]|nr:diacylglycerol kinase family protein [Allosphingosinicella sp.]